jgi:hypothetical protein
MKSPEKEVMGPCRMDKVSENNIFKVPELEELVELMNEEKYTPFEDGIICEYHSKLKSSQIADYLNNSIHKGKEIRNASGVNRRWRTLNKL